MSTNIVEARETVNKHYRKINEVNNLLLENSNKIDKNFLKIHQEKEKKAQINNTNIQCRVVTIDSTDLKKVINGYCATSMLINLAV